MGWYICLDKNEVIINKTIARQLFECGAQISYVWNDGQELTDDDLINYCVGYKDKDGNIRLYFDGNHMEWMDYIWEEEVLDVLKKHKVKGDICFSSNQGDNAGEIWGYRFDGKGNMIKLNGIISYKESK